MNSTFFLFFDSYQNVAIVQGPMWPCLLHEHFPALPALLLPPHLDLYKVYGLCHLIIA